MENPDLVTILRPLMAYDMGTSHQTRWIEATNSYTTQVLYRLGFQWPPGQTLNSQLYNILAEILKTNDI